MSEDKIEIEKVYYEEEYLKLGGLYIKGIYFYLLVPCILSLALLTPLLNYTQYLFDLQKISIWREYTPFLSLITLGDASIFAVTFSFLLWEIMSDISTMLRNKINKHIVMARVITTPQIYYKPIEIKQLPVHEISENAVEIYKDDIALSLFYAEQSEDKKPKKEKKE